jgi:hypothetical protein
MAVYCQLWLSEDGQVLNDTLDGSPNDRDAFDMRLSRLTKDHYSSSLNLSVFTCSAHSNDCCLTCDPYLILFLVQDTLSPFNFTNDETSKQSACSLYT